MAKQENKEQGFFETILSIVGAISGAIIGFQNGKVVGLFVGAIFFYLIGRSVGSLADWLLKVALLLGFILSSML